MKCITMHGVLLIKIVSFQLRRAKIEASDNNTANTGAVLNINHPPLNTDSCVRLQVMADFMQFGVSSLAAPKAREMKAIFM